MAAQRGKFTGYGWPVLDRSDTGPLPRLRVWVIPGAKRHIVLRDGACGFVLVHMALWWHETIGRLDGGTWDEWGYADRTVRGSATVTSEHAGGVAADLDATEHPRGVAIARTFKAWQVAKIRLRIRYYKVLGWGGEFRTPDGMHIEIAKGTTLPQVEARARRLMRTPRGRRILRANPGARDVILS